MGCACAAFLTPTVDRGLGERNYPDIPPLAEFALKRSRRFGLPNQAERREIRSLSHLRVGPHGGDSAFTEQNQAVAGLYGAEPMRDKSAEIGRAAPHGPPPSLERRRSQRPPIRAQCSARIYLTNDWSLNDNTRSFEVTVTASSVEQARHDDRQPL